MKKSNIFFALFFTAFLIVSWYSDNIFDSGLSWIIIFPGMFIWFIICLAVLLGLLIKGKHKQAIVGGIIIPATVFLFFFFPFSKAKVLVEYWTMTPRRMEVVEKIVSGEIDDSSALVYLPSEYKSLSSGGTLYVYKNDSEGVVVGFWEFRGMLSGSRIVMYSTGGEEMIKESASGHPVVNVEPLGTEWYYVETVY